MTKEQRSASEPRQLTQVCLKSDRILLGACTRELFIYRQLRRYRYCALFSARTTFNHDTLVMVKRITRGCSSCDMHQCMHHFDDHHQKKVKMTIAYDHFWHPGR